MARLGRPERNRAARSFRQLRRFHRAINSDKVFGTHTAPLARLTCRSMKSSISNRPVRSMPAIGNLWNFSVVGPFIAGSVQNDKADLVAMLAGNPDGVVGVEPFPKGASS